MMKTAPKEEEKVLYIYKGKKIWLKGFVEKKMTP
jgi:hypothetical protein